MYTLAYDMSNSYPPYRVDMVYVFHMQADVLSFLEPTGSALVCSLAMIMDGR